MQERKGTRSSTNDLEREQTEFVADKNAISTLQYKPLDNRGAQIRRREHM